MPGRDRHRVPRERPGLVHRAQGRDLRHDVLATAERADRHAAADHLAERGQVRGDAVEPLRALRPDAKAGHHLVEDQHRPVLRAERAQRAEELARAGHEVHVPGDRLDDDARDLVTVAPERVLELGDVVEAEHHRVRRGLRSDARGAGVA
jgi:hypothetical protein